MSEAAERGVFHRLRLSEIRRWQIVDVVRNQSVAEHSYRVWVLALDLFDFVTGTSHNSFEREATGRWAMNHDLDEVFTGDLPSTIKPILNRISPGATVKLKEEVLRNTIPDACGEIRGIEGSMAYYIVKIADLVEAVLFITRYAVDKSEGELTASYLGAKIEETCVEATKKHHRIDPKKLLQWLNEVTLTRIKF